MPKKRKGPTPSREPRPQNRYVGPRTIRLVDAVPRGTDMLIGVSFEKCTLLGPAICMPVKDNNFEDCGFGLPGNPGDDLEAAMEAILWEISPSRPHVLGPIILEGCSFLTCNFMGIGWAGDAVTIQKMRAHIGPPQ